MAVQRQAAASKSAKPWSKAQHLSPEGGEPMTRLTTPPRRSTQAPSFNESLGQKGLAGGGGKGFGLGLHGSQALESGEKEERRREKMKMVVARLEASAIAS
ncbi:hypothetical protein LOK49_LG13G02630 [Camellia lanceoleosa]|uniref:Uncharacterized protein n=1 Tax=Camellia lanceoleosa TaxID=1840588 RepID=A0ACC0FLP8_9ERIC|nr:hypothetical protein LOK49_LG13G02630 [Camellia lanceoleosa]